MTNVMRNVLQAAEKFSCAGHAGQVGRVGSKSEIRGYLNSEPRTLDRAFLARHGSTGSLSRAKLRDAAGRVALADFFSLLLKGHF